jgi:hypothetical protein
MKAGLRYLDRKQTMTTRIRSGISLCALAIGLPVLLGACATQLSPQTASTVQVSVLTLSGPALEEGGLAFLTPSTVTGQEEDKQALALSFFETVRVARPKLQSVALPVALTAINRAGLGGAYKHMIEDYRLTGLLDRDVIRKIGQASGVRYLAQLKLASFHQESKNRWGALGFRVFDTKLSNARLFLQIWDSTDGAIVWEGAVELTAAYDSLSEETVTFRSIVEATARELVARLP